ncbi:MAG: hypothetical protein IPJ19_08160 [Planctomycetes bacterium]|nr:hypothetical protein [Planctomycetota bacterium]
MALFNIVRVQSACPRCGATANAEVQFQYGSTRQNSYDVGNELQWGAHDVGERDLSQVVVDGVAEVTCTRCANPKDVDFYIFVTGNAIEKVEVADGRFDFAKSGDTYIALK